MKLVITIPKDKYRYIQELEQDNTDYATTRMLYHAVRHGKPFDDVKAETSEEISKEKWEHISKLSEIRSKYSCFEDDEEPYYRALSEGIKALKAISSADPQESEETNADSN